ncbi:MAG: hypothetical protein J0I20_28155 [Chloroflexi bacterium]|mgnify:CR=1 FL=1|nr:hypothetical protein [Chloroflexota bacterium]OJV97560.1 MAG: hypothetical protein BGO39_07285 [Chloroflexi bacterium 54-19]
MFKTLFSLDRKSGLLAFLLVFLAVDALVIFALYQTRPVYLVDVGTTAAESYLQNFYEIEANSKESYQWTKDHSTVELPLVGSPFTINVQATAFRPKPEPGAVHFSFSWDKPPVTQTFEIPGDQATTTPLKNYSLEVNSRPAFNYETRHLTIEADTFTPGNGDTRSLGLMVHDITVQARSNRFGFVVPPLLTWAVLTLTLLVWQSCLGMFIFRRNLLHRTGMLAFLGGSLLMPLAVASLFFLATQQFLSGSLFFTPNLLVPGLVVLVYLLGGRRVIWPLAGVFALLTLANYYNTVTYNYIFVFGVALVFIVLCHNARLEKTGFNLLIISIIGVLSCWGILQQGLYRTSDAQAHHYFWLNELDRFIHQGEFYPRWATEFAYGHGNAVFNFYAPAARYFGEIFVLAGMPAGTAYQAMLVCITVIGGIGLYLAARQFLNGPGATVAALAYIFNPYRLSNIYQRGSMAEAVAFGILPFVWLGLTHLMNLDYSRRKAILLGAGSYGLLVLSHQLTGFFTIIFLVIPYVGLNLLWLLWQEKKKTTWTLAIQNLGKRVFWVGFALGLGVGLSAFYLLPAFGETGSVWVGNYTRYDPGNMMVDLGNYQRLGDWIARIEKQKTPIPYLENLAWIGISHFVLAGLGLLFSFVPIKGRKRPLWPVALAGVMLVLLLGMQLHFMAFFWENVPYMRFIEFPWRLLIFVGLFAPLLIGFLFERASQLAHYLLRKREGPAWKALAVLGIAIPLVWLVGITGEGNVILHFTEPQLETFGRLSFEDIYTQNGDDYYLPMSVQPISRDDLNAVLAKAHTPYIERDNKQVADPVTMVETSPTSFEIKANLSQPGKLVLPVFYFAGWTLSTNGQTVPIGYNSPYGLITAELGVGQQTLVLKFQDTPIRSAGVILTLISLLVFAGIAVSGWVARRKNRVKEGGGSKPGSLVKTPDAGVLSS